MFVLTFAKRYYIVTDYKVEIVIPAYEDRIVSLFVDN